MTIRITLTEDDFRMLVRGEVVNKPFAGGPHDIEIALADIGFGLMLQALETAMHPPKTNDES